MHFSVRIAVGCYPVAIHLINQQLLMEVELGLGHCSGRIDHCGGIG